MSKTTAAKKTAAKKTSAAKKKNGEALDTTPAEAGASTGAAPEVSEQQGGVHTTDIESEYPVTDEGGEPNGEPVSPEYNDSDDEPISDDPSSDHGDGEEPPPGDPTLDHGEEGTESTADKLIDLISKPIGASSKASADLVNAVNEEITAAVLGAETSPLEIPEAPATNTNLALMTPQERDALMISKKESEVVPVVPSPFERDVAAARAQEKARNAHKGK